jgi:hypothetical protein
MRTPSSPIALLMIWVLASCASAPASSSTDSVSSVAPASPAVSASPTASVASAAPSAHPTPAATPTPAAGQLPVPGFVTISADALTVRQEPGLDGEPVVDTSTCIDNPDPCERPFTLGADRGYLWAYVFDGPVEADGYAWYLLATEMNQPDRASTYPEAVGWVASGDAADAWLVPDERTCPSEPIELADVTNLALTKLEMLHCLGDRELTLRGWLTAPPPGEDDTDLIAECRQREPWLRCGSLFDFLRPEEAEWAGDANYLDFVLDPGSDVVRPERGQWVTVTGAFDHPDAEACGDVAAVLVCRFSFVLTSIRPG